MGYVQALARPRERLPRWLDFAPLNFPGLKSRLLRLLNYLTAAQRESVRRLAEVVGDSLRVQADLQGRVAALEAHRERKDAVIQQLQAQCEDLQSQLTVLQGSTSRLGDRLAGVVRWQRDSVQGAEDLAVGKSASSTLATSDFEEFYAAFETAFRGDARMVQQRQAEYLPLMRAALPAGMPVFDIGCGRGEWMRLLRDQGWPAVGWDINARFVDDNRAQGLDVHHGDALSEIARIAREAPGSLGAVTAFHVIEHISFADLLALVDNALLALADGGVIVFETPNPENLAVGACTFYTDPTHERPLHPATLAFMAERAGFAQAQSWRLTTARGIESLQTPAELPALGPLFALINRNFAAGADFALVARKSLPLPQGVQPV